MLDSDNMFVIFRARQGEPILSAGPLGLFTARPDALWKDKILVSGDGSPVRSYLDQDDLAAWLTSLLTGGQPGEAYNLGSDEPISIRDLAHLVRDLIAPGKQVEVLKASYGTAARQYYVPDISKITKALGVRKTVSLKDSIVKTAEANRV